jgi:ComF family protein
MGLKVERFTRFAVECLARVVAPPRCAACDEPVVRGSAFCAPCAASLVRANVRDPTRLAGFVYDGAIATAIRRFKFDDRPDLATPLLVGFADHVPFLSGLGIELVVPVPLHAGRLIERGYNQAALLARGLASALDTRSAPRALERVVSTGRQTSLGRGGRALNVEHAFVASPRAPIAGSSVLLVDDVETTGATLQACRRALFEAGAAEVRSAVVARAEGEP